jgi:hypothetical protein
MASNHWGVYNTCKFAYRNEENPGENADPLENAYRKSSSLRLPKSRENSYFVVCGIA